MAEPAATDAFRITVGPVSFDVLHGRSTSAIGEPDTAGGTVPAADLESAPTDWSAPAQASIGGFTVTSGKVTEALPDADGDVELAIRSALMLREVLMPPMVLQNLTQQEHVYAAARSAGFAANDIHIDGLETVPTEPMWVLAPLAGVEVERAVRVGIVELLPAQTGHGMLQRFAPALEPMFVDHLGTVSAFARVAVVASTLYDAEQEGLALIDTAAAWLTARLRYSWSHLPDGRPQHYTRSSARVDVRRGEGVGVLAVEGQRRWWRMTTVGPRADKIAASPTAQVMQPPLPAELAAGDRQALLALHRAVAASDPVQRVAALWEAIEFYVGKRNPSRRFGRDEVGAIVDRAVDGLEPGKADRVEHVLRGFLDQAPLMVRLEHTLAEDGVPITSDDLALLRGLRISRNRAVHGSAAAPEHDDIERGIAVLSRAITTRMHRAALT